jgi:hypothetical protein
MTKEETEEAKPSERLPVADIKEITANYRRVELPLEMQARIEQIVEETATREVKARLPDMLRAEVMDLRRLSRVDSSAIAAVVCLTVSALGAIVGVQLAIQGNLPVAQGLTWAVLAGIVGLAIILYARTSLE